MFNLKTNRSMAKMLCNAFALKMADPENKLVVAFESEALTEDEAKALDLKELESFVGHEDTAAVLGVEFRRKALSLHEGDVFYVAEVMGVRLPEGCTTLPEGFKLMFKRVTILSVRVKA